MISTQTIRPRVPRWVAVVATSAVLALSVLMSGALSPAQAQMDVSVSTEFRTALEPHGRWHRHPRWGEVWIPARRERDWRPYTVGHWVYTDDWGWYWLAADTEADWGWVVYHYGRWVIADDLGWVWVPGNEWGPGWVNWRRGDDHFGWAPLPPDRVVVEYRERPDVWIFVRASDFVAPVIARVVLPVREYPVIIRRTVIVNRTVVIRDRRIAVNPGIEPAIIAARVGRPLRAYDVRPVVIAGTARIPNAVEVRGAELRQGQRNRIRVTVRETQRAIEPAKTVPKAQPLAANEQGRLGDNPPRAARGEERQDAREERREERRDDRRDAREERRDEGRDAREERRDERRDDKRDAREDRREQRQEERRDAGQQRPEPRKETREPQGREQRRDAQEQRQQPRQDAQEQRRQERRQDAQDQRRQERRKDAEEQRQERRQGVQEQRQQQRPGGAQTEGRSPPPVTIQPDRPARQPDRPAARDNAPQRVPPPDRPRSEAPTQRAPAMPPAAARERGGPPAAIDLGRGGSRPAAGTTGAAPAPQAAPQRAQQERPRAAPQGAGPGGAVVIRP